MNRRCRIAALIMCVAFFERCAQIGQLTGGKRDTEPPKVLETLPLNKSVNFSESRIVLRFDEFVQVKDIANQLNVAPVMKTKPEVEAEGKKVIITFKKEELQPGTTYKLNFGNAIADMHEGNVLKGYEFVFSTGQVIDSLKISGLVTDAFTNDAVRGVLVGIYDNSAGQDSLPYRKTPDYFVSLGDDGKFSFSNLPPKKFELYAIEDKNKNQGYDREAEKIGFLNQPVVLSRDTQVAFGLFRENAAKYYIKKSQVLWPGSGQVILSRKSNVAIYTLDAKRRNDFIINGGATNKDTIDFYYRHFSDTLPIVIKEEKETFADTLYLSLPARRKSEKRIPAFATNAVGNKLEPDQPLRLIFRQWMDTGYNPSPYLKLSYKRDSVISKVTVNGKWESANSYRLNHVFKDSVIYTLACDTGAFRNTEGLASDSTMFTFSKRQAAEYGKLTVKLKVNLKQAYIVQLVNEQQQAVMQKEISLSLSSSNAVKLDFTGVLPGAYRVKLIYDDNADKAWNSGNLVMKKQAERVYLSPKQVKILPDWEIEEEIIVKD